MALKFLQVFESLAINCVSVVCECIEERLKKDGVFTVGKRRLFPKKRRVRGAKTSFFESKDFVFFWKDGVFSFEAIFLSFWKCRFARKSPQNMENFSSDYLFCFLVLSLGKCWNTALGFVNSERTIISNLRLIEHTMRNSSVRRFTLTFFWSSIRTESEFASLLICIYELSLEILKNTLFDYCNFEMITLSAILMDLWWQPKFEIMSC